MAGFDGTIMFADNVDFSGSNTPAAQITLDGQFLIGSTSAPHIRPGSLTSTGGTVSISYSSPNVNLEVNGSKVGQTVTGTTGGALSPTAGNWNFLGATAVAGTTPVKFAGAVSTETCTIQLSQAIASTDATKVGLATFDSARFTVDANGFVSTNTAGIGQTLTGTTGGALSPTAGNWTLLGATAVAGTTPVQFAGAVSTETCTIQLSQAIASTDATKVGLATFDSARFTVDANGFVSTNTAGIGQTITGTTGGALSPTAGNWNFLGATAVAGTTPVQFAGAVSTETCTIQLSQAIAATDATKVGLATFDSARFTVDANGFVSTNTAGIGQTITGTTGGALSPTAGNWTFLGATAAAGTTPVKFAGAVSTETCTIQFSQAIASTDATKVGLANFNSSHFSVDANGFVSLTAGGGFPFTDQSGTFTAAVNNGYFLTAAATPTLPASPSQGDRVAFIADSSGSVVVTANTGQKIRIANSISSTAGTATNTLQGDALFLVYRSTGATWFSEGSPAGGWTTA